MKSRTRAVTFLVSLAAASCLTGPTSVDVLGLWGGSHVTLQVTSSGGRLEYDCANGVIEEPIRPDRAGRFMAIGTHTPAAAVPFERARSFHHFGPATTARSTASA